MYYVEKTKGVNFIKQFDFPLFTAILMLSVIGIIVLMSALNIDPNNIQANHNAMSSWIKQLVCLIAGIIISIILCTIDYKDFKTLGIAIYIISVFLLILVLLKGEDIHGSRSWLILPVIGQFQPSELAKVAFVVVIPVFFERIKEGQDKAKNILKLIVYFVIIVLLILMQRDVGTTTVVVFAFLVMLFVFGVPYKYFLIAIGAFGASTPLIWMLVLPKYPHIKARILTFLNPEMDLLGDGLQVHRSKMTIGSGQMFGNGLFNGNQTQYRVPFKQNDFIFSVVGEELGFIGCMVVIALIFFILFRSLYIARNSRDDYGTYMVVGITAIFAFHFIENIGMSIGVLPVTGIPLPFMSQGGSALLTNYFSVGILLSVSMRRQRAIFNSSQ
ncbi:MAG: rod shape-determining protein RodA [Clostridiales bacterium]|nr:rod shape-determining protein RodA [Clostridiales bacterium]